MTAMILLGLLALAGVLGVLMSNLRWFAVVLSSPALGALICAVGFMQDESVWLGVGAAVAGATVFQLCYLVAALRRVRSPAPNVASGRTRPELAGATRRLESVE